MVTSCNSDAEFLAATSDKNMIYLGWFWNIENSKNTRKWSSEVLEGYFRKRPVKIESNIYYFKTIKVDFFAEWCGPCKAIAPYFTQLAAEYKEITFLKVDIEKCENTAAR